MPSRNINDLDPNLKTICSNFLAQCWSAGINAFITCTYRSGTEQDADYLQGRSTPGKIITNAKAGQSAHNCVKDGKPSAKAFDFAIKNENGTLDWDATDAKWKEAIKIGQQLGLVSGSCWKMKDNPHFELPKWQAS